MLKGRICLKEYIRGPMIWQLRAQRIIDMLNFGGKSFTSKCTAEHTLPTCWVWLVKFKITVIRWLGTLAVNTMNVQ